MQTGITSLSSCQNIGETWGNAKDEFSIAQRHCQPGAVHIMLFLTMHGIDSDHRTGQRKRAEQSLDRRDFIGLFVAVQMRQHQSRVRSESAKYVRGVAVEEVVEASPQGLAIDRHMTLTFAVRRVVQYGGMAAKCSFDRGGIELPQDATDSCKRELSATSPRTHRATGRGEHR